jgi:hypothetical protein
MARRRASGPIGGTELSVLQMHGTVDCLRKFQRFGMKRTSDNERQILWIMVYGLSLAFGGIFASLETVRSTPRGVTSEISWRTFLVLLLGTGLMVPCFKVVFYSQKKKLRRIALLAIVLVGAAGFLYPLRFIPSGDRREIFIGLITAVTALSAIAGFFWLMKSFFEKEQKTPGADQ